MTEDGQLTVAGCLLFARQPSRFYVGTGVAFAAIDGNDPADPLMEVVQYEVSLFDNLDRLLLTLRSHNRSRVNGFSENGCKLL